MRIKDNFTITGDFCTIISCTLKIPVKGVVMNKINVTVMQCQLAVLSIGSMLSKED